MPEDHVIDVGRLDADFVKLDVDRDIGAAAGGQRGGERSPIGRISDDLVIVPGLKQHVAFWMLDQEKGDRD